MSDDRGAPTSYMALERGTRVVASDGAEVGTVQHVLFDADADIFDGIVIDAEHGGHRFVDAPYVASIAERLVTLNIAGAECGDLPRPSENPAEMHADPDEKGEGELHRKLRRAWDMITGRY